MDNPLEYYGDDSSDPDENVNSDYEYDDDAILLAEKDDDSNKDFKPQNCRVLKLEDVRQRMKEDIANVSSVLSISKAEASILLRYFHWSVSKVNDVWFVDESEIRKKLGLLEKPEVVHHDDSVIIKCGICFEYFSYDGLCSAACGHLYCKECWASYITTSINNDNLRCLSLRCPEPSCKAVVDQDMVDSLVSEEDRKKYSEFMVKSCVEESRNTKWCPGPGCEYVIEFIAGEGSFDVTCICLASFCWNCGEEGHRPLDCETVKLWLSKNMSESENVNYILSYCKPCPNCKRPIEKNQGCSNMTCRICGHNFCWTCLCPNGYHLACNIYKASDTEASRKMMGQKTMQKYMHYFERWDANKRSKAKAIAGFGNMKNEQFKRLSKKLKISDADFDFLSKAWLQIIECRGILGWSFVYGYNLPDNEPAKKQFFGYLQGEAESTLEKLHHCVEIEILSFLNVNNPLENFDDYRNKLIKLTFVTGNYFEKLVKALENDLPGVHESSSGSSSSSSSSKYQSEDEYWICARCSHANPYSVNKCKGCPADANLARINLDYFLFMVNNRTDYHFYPR